MEFINRLLRERNVEVFAVLSSVTVSLVIYFVYNISFLEMFILFSIQTLVLIPINLIRTYRFNWLQGLIEIFSWSVLLFILFQIVSALWESISFDWVDIGKEYYVIIPAYLITGILSSLYIQKVPVSKLELSFLNSLLLRRVGILLFSAFIGLALIKLRLETLAVLCFIVIKAIFEMFILYQSLQFRSSPNQI
jgi:hypothetical protein